VGASPGGLSDDGDDDEGILPAAVAEFQLDDAALDARGLGRAMLLVPGDDDDDDDNSDERRARAPNGFGTETFATLPPFALGSTVAAVATPPSFSSDGTAVFDAGACAAAAAGAGAANALLTRALLGARTKPLAWVDRAATVRGVANLLRALLLHPAWQDATAAAFTRGLAQGVPRHLAAAAHLARAAAALGPAPSTLRAAGFSPVAPAAADAVLRGEARDPRVALGAASSETAAGLAALEVLATGGEARRGWAAGDVAHLAAGVCFDAPPGWAPGSGCSSGGRGGGQRGASVQRLGRAVAVSVVQLLSTFAALATPGAPSSNAAGAALVLLSAACANHLAPVVEATAARQAAPEAEGAEAAAAAAAGEELAPDARALVSWDPLPAVRGVLAAHGAAGDLVARAAGVLALVPLSLLRPAPSRRRALLPLRLRPLPGAAHEDEGASAASWAFAPRALPPAVAWFLAQGLGRGDGDCDPGDDDAAASVGQPNSRAPLLLALDATATAVASSSSSSSRSSSAALAAAWLADEQLAFDAQLLACRARAFALRATAAELAPADASAAAAASAFLEAGLLPALLPLAGASLYALPPRALGADAWRVAKHLPAVRLLAARLAQGTAAGSSPAASDVAALERCAAAAWRRLAALPPAAFARTPWCRAHARALPALAEALQRHAASSASRRGRRALRRLLSLEPGGSCCGVGDDGRDTDDEADDGAGPSRADRVNRSSSSGSGHGSDLGGDPVGVPEPGLGFGGAARRRVLAELDPRDDLADLFSPSSSAGGGPQRPAGGGADSAAAPWFPVGWSARAPAGLLPHGPSAPNGGGADPPLAAAATALAAAESAAAAQRLEVVGRGSAELAAGSRPQPEPQPLAAVDGWRVRALGAFPTVALSGCALAAGEGRWYYEAVLLTDGLMQIGWAAEQAFPGPASPLSAAAVPRTAARVGAGAAAIGAATGAAVGAAGGGSGSFACDPLDGTGCGDHARSWAFDGLRQRRWSVASSPYGDRWRMGDVLGCVQRAFSVARSGCSTFL
jgi:hypothetical protein